MENRLSQTQWRCGMAAGKSKKMYGDEHKRRHLIGSDF